MIIETAGTSNCRSRDRCDETGWTKVWLDYVQKNRTNKIGIACTTCNLQLTTRKDREMDETYPMHCYVRQIGAKTG